MALLEKLEPGSIYLVKLCASNRVGDGPFSDTVELALKHGHVHRSKNPRHSDSLPDTAGQQLKTQKHPTWWMRWMDVKHFSEPEFFHSFYLKIFDLYLKKSKRYSYSGLKMFEFRRTVSLYYKTTSVMPLVCWFSLIYIYFIFIAFCKGLLFIWLKLKVCYKRHSSVLL